ncbi:MAG TPA: hypothetical protein VEV17_09475 [Bryobacteraceae bacterium]|nr:hypothetical protein [Bryobacteraceae bacterium]
MLPSLDPHLVAGIIVAMAFSLGIQVFPLLRRERCACLFSLVMAAAYYGREFPGFALVSGFAFILARWLAREPLAARRWGLACLAIALLVIGFTAGRVAHWDRLVDVGARITVAVYSLGMWPVLKLVTLFWEVGSGSLAAPSFTRFALWSCLPFTIGGPVLRMSQMPAAVVADGQLWKSIGWWREAIAAAAKLAAGISLGTGLAFLTGHWPQDHYLNNAVAAFLTGPIGFYLTTAGYFHWMELLGRVSGFKLPPSFNYPIGRENISAFWMNWNMTATYVFRDYLFYNRWGRRTYNVYFNTILLFTLVGLWHAANAYWILWGFLHGLLFASFLLWRRFGQRLRNIPLRGTPLSKTAARALTYFSVCMCWYLPSKILQKLAAI